VENLVHVLFGIRGVVAYGGLFAPRVYAQIVAVASGLLVILGLLPATNTLFGLIPIYGNDVWLHLVLGAVAPYFGYRTSAEAPVPWK
jgi:hypothetical protein